VVTPETIYSLASLTKPLTATGIMLLAERGKVDLDEPIEKYVSPLTLKSYVVGERANKGIASAMIEELIGCCKEHGYTRIEVPVDPRPPDEAGANISFYPFRKFGFVLDEVTIGWEFRPETRMCFCDL
jgi:GNAT superfamily N-acetyltransferase